MASASTTNYSLPQYAAGDLPTWDSDWNPAFQTIDAQMKANADAASSAQTAASNAASAASAAQQTANQGVSDASAVAGRVTALETKVGNSLVCASNGEFKLN